MRKIIAILAGLVPLTSVSAQAVPLAPAKMSRVEIATARRSSWPVKAAAGVGIAVIGETAGATGIGDVATRIGEFPSPFRCVNRLSRIFRGT
jgi:hypothetical protein